MHSRVKSEIDAPKIKSLKRNLRASEAKVSKPVGGHLFLDVYRALALALIERVTARICSGEQKQLLRGHRRCTRVHQTLRRVSGVSQFAPGGRFGGPNDEDADEDSVGRISLGLEWWSLPDEPALYSPARGSPSPAPNL